MTDGRANPLIDRKVVGVVFFGVHGYNGCSGVVAMVAVVTSPTCTGIVVPVLGKIVVPWGSVFRKSRAFSKNA